MNDSGRSNKFLWVGNDTALDFVNTLVRHDGPDEDLLTVPQDLTLWLQEAGVATTPEAFGKLSGATLKSGLAAARAYRGLLRSALAEEGFQRGPLASLVERTNELLATPTSVMQLSPSRLKTYALTASWTYRAADDLLRPVAHSFAELLTIADHRRIRKCRNPDCILFFYDTSKSGTRAWCSLDICGNKLRVAAFRRRHNPAKV